MLNADYAKAHAAASAAASLSRFVDLCLMAEGNRYADALLEELDREWPAIAADPAILDWYRSSVELLRNALDPTRSSIAPGSAARPAPAHAT